jgi:hypothetical protein
MLKPLLVLLLLSASACGSDNGSASPGGGGASGNSSCPDVSGSWKVTKHCEASLVGATLDVTETSCALTFAAPFDQFMGSVTADGKITLSGPQSCTGTATAQSVSMVCTPGTCDVTLAR